MFSDSGEHSELGTLTSKHDFHSGPLNQPEKEITKILRSVWFSVSKNVQIQSKR